MNRFSKMFSRTRLTPSACVARAKYWACISVGNPGYSSVEMSAARSWAAALTRIESEPSTSMRAPASSSFEITAPKVSHIAVGDNEGRQL